MNTQLTQHIGDKTQALLKEFIKFPENNHPCNLPYEHYYYHNFNSFFSDFFNVINHLIHINKSTHLESMLSDSKYNCISLTLDSKGNTVRQIAKSRESLYEISTKHISQTLNPIYFEHANNSYQQLECQYIQTETSVVLLGGVYIKTANEKAVSYTVFAMTFTNPYLIPISCEQTKIACQNAYHQFLTTGSTQELEQINPQDFLHYFGSEAQAYVNKHNFFKAWELTLFSNMEKSEIAQNCGYASWSDWLTCYQQIDALANKPVAKPRLSIAS